MRMVAVPHRFCSLFLASHQALPLLLHPTAPHRAACRSAGARVINLSLELQSSRSDPSLAAPLRDAFEALTGGGGGGLFISSAAGNNGLDCDDTSATAPLFFPVGFNFSGAVAVANMLPDGTLAYTRCGGAGAGQGEGRLLQHGAHPALLSKEWLCYPFAAITAPSRCSWRRPAPAF